MSVPLVGARIRAADLSAIFPVNVDAWTTFTPSLSQSVAVTKTVTHAQYMKIGRLVIANYYMTATGTGTAAAVVLVGLPVPCATAALASIGSGMIFDASAGTFYTGVAIVNDTNTFKLAAYNAGNYLGGGGFTAALATNDIISAFVCYQATS